MARIGRKCQQNADAVESGTLAEQVYRRLSAAILAGELAAGSKISEPALARQYGVSRGPLREALHRLQERKLITRSANQGAADRPAVARRRWRNCSSCARRWKAWRHGSRRINATDAEVARLRAAVGRGRH